MADAAKPVSSHVPDVFDTSTLPEELRRHLAAYGARFYPAALPPAVPVVTYLARPGGIPHFVVNSDATADQLVPHLWGELSLLELETPRGSVDPGECAHGTTWCNGHHDGPFEPCSSTRYRVVNRDSDPRRLLIEASMLDFGAADGDPDPVLGAMVGGEDIEFVDAQAANAFADDLVWLATQIRALADTFEKARRP